MRRCSCHRPSQSPHLCTAACLTPPPRTPRALQPSAAVRLEVGENDENPFEGMEGTPVTAAVTGERQSVLAAGWGAWS